MYVSMDVTWLITKYVMGVTTWGRLPLEQLTGSQLVKKLKNFNL